MTRRMRIRWTIKALTTLLAFGCLAAPAALGWGPVAVRDSGPRTVATCLRGASGTPTLSVLGRIDKRASTLDVLNAKPDGFTPSTQMRFGSLRSCPELAMAGTTTVAAGVALGPGQSTTLQAAVTDGGPAAAVALGPMPPDPIALGVLLGGNYPALETPFTQPPAVAVAASVRGDALVAWSQTAGAIDKPVHRRRILVSRRLPGGAFGPAQVVSPWEPTTSFSDTLLDAAYDAAGNVTVAWSRGGPAGAQAYDDGRTVEVATAEPGAPLRTETLATPHETIPLTLRLAVAPDGHALLVYDFGNTVQVAERTAAGRAFHALGILGAAAKDPSFESPTVAVLSGGAGLLAWQTQAAGDEGEAEIMLATRTADGAFTTTRQVSTARRSRIDWDSQVAYLTDLGRPPSDKPNLGLRSALSADGRFSLVWTNRRRSAFGDAPFVANALVGSLGGAVGAPETLSCGCRAVNGVAALLVGGEPAVAFTDNETDGRADQGELARSAGRTHLWLPSATRNQPPRPRLRIVAPRRQLLRWGEPLRVRVHCSAACDLRGTVTRPLPDDRTHLWRALGTASLAREGNTWLRMFPPVLASAVPSHARRVRVAVRAYGRDGSHFSLRSVSAGARLRPTHPLPRPFAVRIRHAGRDLIVTWRYPRAPTNMRFILQGRVPGLGEQLHLTQALNRNRRGRYRVVLRPTPSDRVSTVMLLAVQLGPLRFRKRTLPVPR